MATTDIREPPAPTEPKRKFKFPTAFTVLFFVLVLVWILTFVIQPGTYAYVSCDGGPPKPIPARTTPSTSTARSGSGCTTCGSLP